MPAGNVFAIAAPTVFDGGCFLADHCVIVSDDTVSQILPAGEIPAGLPLTALRQGTLAPGLVDLQVNGGGGVMLNSVPAAATVQTMVAAHRAQGTTALLPTVMSDTLAVQQAAVAAIGELARQSDAAVLGVHLEGPFFNPEKRGAHSARLIRTPQAQDIDWLCTLDNMRVMVTLAPEQVTAQQLARLCASGVIVCAGHTNATYQQVEAAATQGLQGVTHLFNAMRQATAREPGAVGAALAIDALWAGIIADGHHVHPASLRLAYRAKPRGRLLLVSDAMASVGSAQDTVELYGETIRQEAGRLVNAEGRLAGSAISLMQAVDYASRQAGLPLAECLRMASLYPATVIGLGDRLGRIAADYRADLVHFDDDFRVLNTWVAGQHQSHQ